MQVAQREARWFGKKLIDWYERNDRPMPWKEIDDPYLIWLSEIILQQTRVEQGWDYFLKFKAAFPKVEDLAAASEQEVLKLWQGLGYYSRARNLHASAKIVTEAGGKFKADYNWLLGLKGVGPYTAAAIASFAFKMPYAVVDGNVYRLLSRFFALDTAIDSTAGKKLFQQLADQLLLKKDPARYNQAIIDFGATICKPRQPICGECPLKSNCQANQQNNMELFPVKEKKLKKKTRFFFYLQIEYEGKILFKVRREKDIWNGLYDFPLIERQENTEITELTQSKEWREFSKSYRLQKDFQLSKSYKQQLTHQTIHGRFIKLRAQRIPDNMPDVYQWVTAEKIRELPFPKMISFYLGDKHLSLNLQ